MFCKQLAGNHVPHQDHIRGVFPAISLKLLNHPPEPFFASAPIAGHDDDGDDDVGDDEDVDHDSDYDGDDDDIRVVFLTITAKSSSLERDPPFQCCPTSTALFIFLRVIKGFC